MTEIKTAIKESSPMNIDRSHGGNTTQMILSGLKQKVDSIGKPIKKENLRLLNDTSKRARHKLKLMRKLKPAKVDLEIFSSDSEA